MKKLFTTLTIVLLTSVLAFSQNYFRSKKSGAYNTTTTWESSSDSVTWVNATAYPNNVASSVTISAGHAITATTTATVNVKNLTVSSTSTITFGFFKEFKINGKLTNNGTINHNSSTVTFAGATDQVLQGSSTTLFYVLKIDKSSAATITIKSPVQIDEMLSFGTSAVNTLTVDPSGSFTFLSSSVKTAHIDILSSPLPIMNGTYNCQKFFPAQTGRYNFMLGSPAIGATFAQLQPTTFDGSGYPTNGFWITGGFTGNNNGAVSGLGSAASSFIYSPTSGLYSAYPNTSNTQTLDQGHAFRFSIRDGGSAVTTTVDKLLTTSGSLAVGDFTYMGIFNGVGTKPFASGTLTGINPPITGGWNLICNPYMSDISIDLTANWILDSINLTSYIYEASSKNFLPCASGVPAENCIVSAYQGFWIQANGTPSVTVQETAKQTSQNTTPVYRTAQASTTSKNYLTLELFNQPMKIKNKTYIRYNDEAVEGSDKLDGFKLGVDDKTSIASVSIYSKYKGVYYDVNSKPIKAKDTTQLYIKTLSGANTISFNSNLEDGYTITLHDKVLNKYTDLKTSSYSFNVADSTSGNRFELITTYTATTGTYDDLLKSGISIYPNTFTNHLTINSSQKVDQVTIFDILGNQVYNGYNTNVIETNFSSGIYFIKVLSGGKTITEKVIKQ